MAGPRRQTYVHKFKKRFEEINVFGVKIRVLDRYRIAVTHEQQVECEENDGDGTAYLDREPGLHRETDQDGSSPAR